MPTAYISMGSNIRPRQNVATALRLLSKSFNITGVSTVYRTKPELNKKQPQYYNCVIAVKTNISAKELKYRFLRKIEKLLGRKWHKDKFASRTIDLDLIAYGRLKTETAGMTLPDPEIPRRKYLAAGLGELKYGSSARPDTSMKPLPGYTKLLRKKIKWSRISPR
jgi:2-amino-4-hydroxy-6-hydroxymethyldihydropteridine diphosphokinase